MYIYITSKPLFFVSKQIDRGDKKRPRKKESCRCTAVTGQLARGLGPNDFRGLGRPRKSIFLLKKLTTNGFRASH